MREAVSIGILSYVLVSSLLPSFSPYLFDLLASSYLSLKRIQRRNHVEYRDAVCNNEVHKL
jgi:hypothetical protein